MTKKKEQERDMISFNNYEGSRFVCISEEKIENERVVPFTSTHTVSTSVVRQLK